MPPPHEQPAAAAAVAPRYLELRELERRAPADAIVAAEALAARPPACAEDRLLSVNALGVLARLEGGRGVLERFAREGPSEELRRTARALLARRAR